MTGMSDKSNDEEFLVAYPKGTGGGLQRTCNGGRAHGHVLDTRVKDGHGTCG